MPASDDPVVIAPIDAPLSRAESATSGRLGRRRSRPRQATARVLWFGIGLALLGGLAAVVFLVLPERIETPLAVLPTQQEATPSNANGETVVPPFRLLEMQRAQRQAQDKLNEFMDLQLTLEQDLNVADWGTADLAAIIEIANAGDALFLESEYEAAMARYAAAVDGLSDLQSKGEDLFRAALADGAAALDSRDHAAAVAAFERAAVMRPQHPDVVAGNARAAKMPQVATLLRESRRANLRGDFDEAYRLLTRIRDLDPRTAGLSALLAETADRRAEGKRKAKLSQGFAALEDGDHDTALSAFDAVLRDHPDDAGAQAGRQQTRQAQVLATIEGLRREAEAQRQDEDFAGALASYEQALAIDPSLQFARAGRDRVATVVRLVETMQRIVADPALLSSDDEFAAAERTLRTAEQEAVAGSKFAARLERYRAVVQRSATPVPLVLVSDNATEVTIHKVGPIGAFDRKQIALRPGRYVIVGSRDGCRDVRKEIVLASDTAPIDIRCAEPI